MVKEKISYGNRISKWLDKKELKVMAEGLDKDGEEWRYGRSKVSKKWAIFLHKEEGFEVPHWLWWKYSGWQFNKCH